VLLPLVEEVNLPPFPQNHIGDEITEPFLMLYGYALENIFKGICVANEKYKMVNGKFTGKTHKLIQLAKDTDVILTDDEHWLLQRLTAYTIWAGRYPSPTSADEMEDVARPDGLKDDLTGWNNHDIFLLKKFYKKSEK